MIFGLKVSRLQVHLFKKKVGLVYSNFYKLYKNKKKLTYKNDLPSGKVTSQIIKNYQIGILTVLLKRAF